MARPPVRLTDVARAAAVSVSTASRALNADSRISEVTRRRVEKASARLGYRPDLVARGLTLGRTFAVGLVVGDLANPFYADLARGVEEALDPEGYIYLLANSDGDPARQRELAQRLLDRRVDGLMLTVPYDPATLGLKEVPLVAFDRASSKVPYVSVDNVLGARMAVEHLLDEGYRQVGILYARPDDPPVRDRLAGYRAALKGAGIASNPALRMCSRDLGYDAGLDGARQLVAAGADAIFAVDDVIAVAALAAAREAGRRVPQDLGVVGFDDTAMASWPSIDLTSVNQSTVRQGREGGAMMLRLIENPNARTEPVIIPPQLSVRGSSRRSAGRN
ncbi:MAG: LacI family transcriptional regulator [Chloroflexota bacterium]|jgi:LacI family transcriptional regulator|nr:LacI family transcriptional regulator [Chloroflexota bacterium]